MSDTAGVRWYRHGDTCLGAAIMISFLAIFPAWLFVYGIGDPVRWMFLVPGAVLIAGIAALAWLPVRAGIGVTPEHILVRSAFGDTRTVPWAQVTGFEAGTDDPEGKGKAAVLVLTSAGERLHTGGYSPHGPSPAEAWPLLRALEAERLARTPGATSTLPPEPPPPKPGHIGGSAIVAALGVIALIVFGVPFMYGGIAELWPALRAAHGGGAIGYFIPREIPGNRAPAVGDFRLADGTVTRQHTTIQDLSKGALHTGVPVAARDTGDPDFVYPRNDQGAWHGPMIAIVGAAWSLGSALIVIIRAGIHWLRRAHHGADGHVTTLLSTAARTAASPADRPDSGCRRQARDLPQANAKSNSAKHSQTPAYDPYRAMTSSDPGVIVISR